MGQDEQLEGRSEDQTVGQPAALRGVTPSAVDHPTGALLAVDDEHGAGAEALPLPERQQRPNVVDDAVGS